MNWRLSGYSIGTHLGPTPLRVMEGDGAGPSVTRGRHESRLKAWTTDDRICRVPMVRCPYAQARLVVWIEEGW